LGDAGDAAEDGSERAAQDVCGFPGGKVDRFFGDKRKPERLEPKNHASFYK